MLNNKKITMVLSLILAVGLWAYVVGVDNPNTTELHKQIPITLLNQETLEAQDLAVLSVSDETIDVRLGGQRSAVSKVENDDIIATVDLSEADAGQNEIKVNISVRTSEEVEISDKSLSRITVMVEEAATVSKPVQVTFEGEYEQGEEPTAIDVSRNTVTVTGAKSLVEAVDHVQAVVDAGKVTSEMKSFKSSLVAVDENGARVDKVTLSQSTVYVSAALWQTKTVPLTVPVEGLNAGEAEREAVAPKTITIKGRGDTIKNITGITAQTIDLSEVMTSRNIDIVPILPDGVELAHNSSGITLAVTVKGYISQTFTYRSEDIDVTGQSDEQQTDINTEDIEVTITGREEVISKLTEADIQLSINIADVTEGTHRVPLRLSCDADYSRLTASPAYVRVTVR